jgi:isocitrate/isopropylmalate dehydrogenase
MGKKWREKMKKTKEKQAIDDFEFMRYKAEAVASVAGKRAHRRRIQQIQRLLKQDVLDKIDMLIRDCRYHMDWDLYEEDNWTAMAGNLQDIRTFVEQANEEKEVWDIDRYK